MRWVDRQVKLLFGEAVEDEGAGAEPDGSEVAERAKSNGTVTRREAAAFLRVSTKTVQRMEAAGQMRRCPGLAAVVRYAAREVLRLASVRGRED